MIKKNSGFNEIIKVINNENKYVSIYQILKELHITKNKFLKKYKNIKIELIFNSLRSNCIEQEKNMKDFVNNIIDEQEKFLAFVDQEIEITFVESDNIEINNENIKLVNNDSRD